MASNIKFKRSAVQNRVPTTSQLDLGELALNTYDGKLYTEINTGSAAVVEIGSKLSSLVVDGDNGAGGGDVTFHGTTAGRDLLWDYSENSLRFSANAQIKMGVNAELFQLFNDDNNTNFIRSASTNLRINSDIFRIRKFNDTDHFLNASGDQISLYHAGLQRIQTTADGADIFGTGSLKIPVGTTAQRSSSPVNGDLRYNTTTGGFEGYSNNNWGELGAGGIGIGSTSTNPSSGVVGNRIGVGFTDINIVGTGVSVTGYGTTIVIDFNDFKPGSFHRTIHNYTATAGQTTFAGLSYQISEKQIAVYLNGARLSESTYTATSGTTVVLDVGASVGDEVEIINIHTNSDVDRKVNTYTATAGQTTFTGLSYNSKQELDVYLNGIRLASADFTATSGNTVVLAVGASVNDIIDIVSTGDGVTFRSTSDASGDRFTLNNLGIGTNQTPNALNVVGNVNVVGVLTATTFKGDGSQLTGIAVDATALKDSNGNVKIQAASSGAVHTGISTFNGDIQLISTDGGSAVAPEFKLYRNSASPADADYLGQLKFAGESDTGVERNYAKISGKILDASNGTEDGILEFAHIKGGSQTITGRWRSDSLQLLNSTNFSVAGTSEFSGDVTITNTAPKLILTDTDNNSDFRIKVESGQFDIDDTTSSNATRLRIYSNGEILIPMNVGFGVANPSEKVDVDGNIKVTGDVNIADKIIHIGDTNTAIRFPLNDTVSVETSGTEQVRIDSSGNVNVAGIATVAGNLVVAGNLTVTGTQTQDDVANVDSVGIITARAGIDVTGGTLKLPAVTGTNTNADLNVLFQTASGVIDGGSQLTYNPGGDSLSVNGNFINTNTFRGSAALGRLTCANHSATTKVDVSNTIDITTVDNTTDAFTLKQGSNEYITVDTNNSSELITLGNTTTNPKTTILGGTVQFKGDANPVIELDRGSANNTNINLKYNGTLTGQVSAANAAFELSAVGASTPISFYTDGDKRLSITSGGSVNIGGDYSQSTHKLKVTGSFAATTKSFVIDHPTKENHKLQYACLEGPENSVYVRGRSSDPVIELPDYWVGLVHEDSITVNVTPIGNKNVWVESINNNSVTIGTDGSTEYFYTVFAERKDVEKLEVEVQK